MTQEAIMQTNPEQWAVELCIALGIPDHHAPTIQAAFAEREARLVSYVRHGPVCTLNMRIGGDCSCGLTATFAALKDRTHG